MTSWCIDLQVLTANCVLIGDYTRIAHLTENRMTQQTEEQKLKRNYSFGKAEN